MLRTDRRRPRSMRPPLRRGLLYHGGFPFDFTKNYVEVCIYDTRRSMLAAIRTCEKHMGKLGGRTPANTMGSHVSNDLVLMTAAGRKPRLSTPVTGRIYLNEDDLSGPNLFMIVIHEFLHAASWYLRVTHWEGREATLDDMNEEEIFADKMAWPIQCFMKVLAERAKAREDK